MRHSLCFLLSDPAKLERDCWYSFLLNSVTPVIFAISLLLFSSLIIMLAPVDTFPKYSEILFRNWLIEIVIVICLY